MVYCLQTKICREVDLEWCAQGKVHILVDSQMSADETHQAEDESRYVHNLIQAKKTLFKARTRWEPMA